MQSINTKENYINEKNKEFNKNYELIKNNYNNEINSQKPKEIDFNDIIQPCHGFDVYDIKVDHSRLTPLLDNELSSDCTSIYSCKTEYIDINENTNNYKKYESFTIN